MKYLLLADDLLFCLSLCKTHAEPTYLKDIIALVTGVVCGKLRSALASDRQRAFFYEKPASPLNRRAIRT